MEVGGFQRQMGCMSIFKEKEYLAVKQRVKNTSAPSPKSRNGLKLMEVEVGCVCGGHERSQKWSKLGDTMNTKLFHLIKEIAHHLWGV